MKSRCLSLCFATAAWVILLAFSTYGQVPAGTPPFGSFAGSPDILDLSNLNAHLVVPVLNKPGRGTNFTYNLTYDSSVWYPVTAGSTTSWQPASNWGWAGQTQAATGYFTYSTSQQVACNGHGEEYIATNFVYVDSLGVGHYWYGSAYTIRGNTQCNTGNWPFNGVATDGSGLALYVAGGQGGINITTRYGTAINAPVNTTSGAGSFIDRNGNEISINGSGQFFDTLSGTTPVLTVAGVGSPSSPITFTYKAPSGVNASYTMNYTSYTVATNYGVSGVSEYGAHNVSLVSSM